MKHTSEKDKSEKSGEVKSGEVVGDSPTLDVNEAKKRRVKEREDRAITEEPEAPAYCPKSSDMNEVETNKDALELAKEPEPMPSVIEGDNYPFDETEEQFRRRKGKKAETPIIDEKKRD